MDGNRRRSANRVTAVAVLSLAAISGAASAGKPQRIAAKAFDPPVSGIASRPAILLETDSYVYGPETGFDTPQLTVTLENHGYSQPTTFYLYWQNRSTGETRYYNLAEAGFSSQERDLFGRGTTPAKVFVPDFDELALFGPGGVFGPLPGGLPTAVGLYQLVLEVRDAQGSQTIARSNAMFNRVSGVESVGGNLNDNMTFTSDKLWYLESPTYFQNGAVLTIQPGTVIFGSKAGQGTLVIRRGSRILADGDVDRPIIFSSELPVGQRGPGDWGGLVVNGAAPTNQPGDVQGEGDSGPFGGNDPNDDSGVLRYVRVEFAGIRFSEQNELNGIALQGVGSNTVIEHVQVHQNLDDGIEFFGGTANAKWVLITDCRDDSLDWVMGWTGKLQFGVFLQRQGDGGNGIEADNWDDNPSLTPFSNPRIYNVTFVGNLGLPQASGSNRGALLRFGTQGELRNGIWVGYGTGIDVNGADSQGHYAAGDLVVTHSIVFDNTTAASVTLDSTVLQEGPRLPNPRSPLQPDVAPLPGSPARVAGNVFAVPNDGFFTPVNYIGGVNPNNPWIQEGWTTFSDN
jgi:hypothetical protein